MTGRIYVRDFSYEATAEDLSSLISKVCPVEEVYISGKTPTGINRSFAIVVVTATDPMIEKCIKTFNNCHWKGTKIWVERAKEYYKDRFERERARERKLSANTKLSIDGGEDEKDLDKMEEQLNREIESDDVKKAVDDISAPALDQTDTSESTKPAKTASASSLNVIKIKKSRDGLPIAISMVPASSSSTAAKKSKKVIMCGRRTVFNYDDTGSILYTPMATDDAATSGDDSSDDSEEEVEENDAEKEAKLKLSQKLNKNKEVSKHNKDARAIATGAGPVAASTLSAAESSRSQGGGARKGFGGLSTVPVSALPVPLSQAYLKKLVATPVGNSTVDCCVEKDSENRHIGQPSKVFGLDTDDLRNDSAKESIEFAGDDDNRNPYRVEDVPCVGSEELTDEALAKERQRSMDMFASIMKGSAASALDSTSSVQGPKKKTLNSTVCISDKEKEKEMEKGNNSEKNNALQIQGNLKVVNVWESEKSQRFDPKNKKTSAKVLLSVDQILLRNETARNAAAASAAAAVLVADAASAQSQSLSASAVHAEEKGMNNFANLDSLKNIFHQEGGVWWGDDGTLNDAVSKGNIAEDPLFREAEKMGIDIRKKRQDEMPSESQGGSHSLSSALGKENTDSTKMTFGFFEEYFATDTAAASTSLSAPVTDLPNTTIPQTVHPIDVVEELEMKKTVKKVSAKTLDLDSKIPSRSESDSVAMEMDDEVVVEEKAVVFMNLKDVMANAKKFCRDRSEAELFEDWKESRDRLVIDYKRKSKDAKKKILFNAKASFSKEPSSSRPTFPEVRDKAPSSLGKRGRDRGQDRGGKKGRGSSGVVKKIFVK